MARVVSPNEFGTFAMVAGLLVLGELIRDAGLSLATLRAPHLSTGAQSNVFWTNILIGGILTVGLYAAADPLSNFYGNERVRLVAQLISPVFLINGFCAQFRVVLARTGRYRSLALIDVAPLVVGMAVGLGIALEAPLIGLCVQQLLPPLLTAVALPLIADWRPGLPARHAATCPILLLGLQFTGSQVLRGVTRTIDSVLIGKVWGATTLGFYDRGYQLFVAPQRQLYSQIARVSVPDLAREFPAAAVLRLYVGVVSNISLVAFLSAGLAAPHFVPLVLGSEWRTTGQLMLAMCVGVAFRAAAQPQYWLYTALGLGKRQLRHDVIGQGILIAGILAGLSWGAFGVSIGFSIAAVVYWVIGWLLCISDVRAATGVVVDFTYPLRGAVISTLGFLLLLLAFWVQDLPALALPMGALGLSAMAYVGVDLISSVRTSAGWNRRGES